MKQTKCPACMEKWKIPLPEPKVPAFTPKSAESSQDSIERIASARLCKTDSRRRIQNMIEQEQFKLNSYDKRFSNASTTSNPAKKRVSPETSSLDLVALNILDLEKIRHEIREKETKKKLEKFLEATQN